MKTKLYWLALLVSVALIGQTQAVEDEEASLRHEAAAGHHSIRCRVEVLAVAG